MVTCGVLGPGADRAAPLGQRTRRRWWRWPGRSPPRHRTAPRPPVTHAAPEVHDHLAGDDRAHGAAQPPALSEVLDVRVAHRLEAANHHTADLVHRLSTVYPLFRGQVGPIVPDGQDRGPQRRALGQDLRSSWRCLCSFS